MLYWLSHSSHEDPSQGSSFTYQSSSNSALVSIILDDGARYAFRAIRFIVVCKPSTSFDQWRITRSTNTEGVLENATKSLFRTRLRIDRDISQTVRSEICHPICNVIFEAVRVHAVYAKEHITLVPCTMQPTSETPRVLFEQLSLIDSTNPALNIFLDGTFSHNTIGGIPVHSVRILPSTGRCDAHSWASLDPRLVVQIINLLVGSRPLGWRPMFLNYSLVCKSWSHVLSFFALMNDTQRLDARHIARALDAKPHYGSLISKLDDYHLKFGDFEDSVWWDAFLRILQHATLARSISMPLVPLPLADVAVRHLSALRNVETFCMSHTFHSDHGINISEAIPMSTIQSFMSNWKKLSNLEIHGWADEYDCQTAPGASSCSFQLIDLTLASGTITGSQLLHFVPPTPPMLSVLFLFSIKGLTNADFTVFLDAVAPSLEELRLHECWFEKASSSEELALDATMSKMNLGKASVNPNHISILTLLRKKDMPNRVPKLFVRSVRYKPGNQSGVDDIVTFFVERNRTGWEAVTVLCYTAELTHLDSRVDASIAAAKVNGTTLYLQTASAGW